MQIQCVCFAVFDQDIYNINLDLDKSSDRAAPAEKTRSQFVLGSRSRVGGHGGVRIWRGYGLPDIG